MNKLHNLKSMLHNIKDVLMKNTTENKKSKMDLLLQELHHNN